MPVSGFRSLYGADSASQPPTLLGMASAGRVLIASSALGAGRSSGYGCTTGQDLPTASGAAMEWKPRGAALLSLEPAVQRHRQVEVHDREHGRRTAQKVSSTSEVRAPEDIHAPPAVPKATPLKASTGGRDQQLLRSPRIRQGGFCRRSTASQGLRPSTAWMEHRLHLQPSPSICRPV